MPDENRFDSIADELEADDADEEEVEQDEDGEHPDSSMIMSDTEATPTNVEDSGTDLDEEAFGSSETVQRPAYARESTWEAFDDALDFDVEQALRERGIRNATKREKIDAVLRLAVSDPDEIAERVLDARRHS